MVPFVSRSDGLRIQSRFWLEWDCESIRYKRGNTPNSHTTKTALCGPPARKIWGHPPEGLTMSSGMILHGPSRSLHLSRRCGCILGSYLKKKGENLATHEDIDKLVDQVQAVTKATKEIETKISSDLWDRQKQWDVETLFAASNRMSLHSHCFCRPKGHSKSWFRSPWSPS